MFIQENVLVWGYSLVFIGQTTARGVNRIRIFRAGSRTSGAILELPPSKVKVFWDVMLHRMAIIIIIIKIIIQGLLRS
jgi:hypothetical protein